MKHIAAFALCLSLATPAVAQVTEEGFDLMEKGVQMLLRGLMDEIEPSMNDMQSLLEEFGPSLEQFSTELAPILQELLTRVDDFKHYEKPEILPNGDIIIRRRDDAPEFEVEVDEGDRSIDL